MAKLRKMLGRVDEPNIVELMAVIETQSRETLSAWALDWAENHFLEIYEKYDAEDLRLRSLVDVCRECLEGERPLKEIKPFLKEAREAAKAAEKIRWPRRRRGRWRLHARYPRQRPMPSDLLFTAQRPSFMMR